MPDIVPQLPDRKKKHWKDKKDLKILIQHADLNKEQ
jgi:hypothetical protein